MRHSIFLFLILGLTYFLSIISCGQKEIDSEKKVKKENTLVSVYDVETTVYELSIPLHDSTDRFPETVIRIKKVGEKPAFLKFRPGGTETDIKFVDSSSAKNYKSFWDCPSSHSFSFGYDQNSLFDISDYEKGTYYILYSSCNVSGTYKLIIESK